MAEISAVSPGSRGIRGRWEARVRRWVIMGLVIVAVTWVATTYGVPMYLQARLLYWQHLCLTYSDATGKPAYWYDPMVALGSQLAETPDYDNDMDGPTGPIPDDQCCPIPPHILPVGGQGDPESLVMLNRRLNFVLYDGFQPVFIHELTNQAEVTRLVVVSIGPSTKRGLVLPPTIETLVLEPAGMTTFPRITKRRAAALQNPNITLAPTTFMWGSVDASDPSRFHIPYRQGDKTYQLDGRLNADGAATIDVAE